MRIAIVTPQFPALSETFIANKVKALAERGHVIKVFTGKINYSMFQQLFTNTTNIKVAEWSIKKAARYTVVHPVHVLKSITKKNKKKYFFCSFIIAAINRFKPQIIHFEFSGAGVEYLDVFNKIDCKKVVSCRGSAEKVKLLVDAERKKNFAQLMQAVDAVHCVSDDMRNTIKEYIELSKTFVNYPSIDAHFFNRTSAYMPNKVSVIVSIGRFTFQKNYLIGLLAMRCIADRGINFKWIIIGNGPQHEEILFHIQQLELQNYVELLGTKTSSEIKVLLEKADIFLLTSVYEGIANAALEAMSMQLPVVSTTCGGMPEVITCGKNGLLAGVYDYQKLAEHIIYLINHPQQAKEIGIAARERILEQFTLQQQTDTFERIYQQLSNTLS